ncbi:DUF4142 domain-containing protein [Aggregicoccus sp. 17bor-14]|uniref:DUF4142 domain-containing protein n=1 Tax=Myxococcaceae TaxID=31 RepID=UPI00129CC891|nr:MULTISPECIES: DUF4142 domain-containing protein [Myxococcaceae]MBF5043329.1 DUF4142 domain-containing protein [Simulacricoccus sp. 17bor-14]MRI89088.1 DUF4142 domain-containing protein [Aggregicoccus sp. 17bor-14]
MRKHIGSWLVAGALLVGGPGLAQSSADAGTASAGTDALTTAKQLIGQDESGLLQRLHQANKMEVELGQLAQQKATDSDVKQYGQMMVTDHQALDQQLKAYAQKKGVTLSEDEPSAANDTEKAVMEAEKASKAKLQALQGPSFQYAYVADMVEDHDMDISKVAAAMEQFKSNAELVKMLEATAPKLTEHRERAYTLLGRHKAKAHMASSGKK